MEPHNNRFGGGPTETLLNPTVAVLMLIAIVLILVLPRNKVITPFLLAIFNIPASQVLLVGGMHFTMTRVLIVFGLVRILRIKLSSSSQGWFPTGFGRIDQVVVLWTLSAFVIISLQWMNGQMLIASLGQFLDALGGYLVLRFFMPDGETVRRAIKVFAAVCVIHGTCMIYEQATGFNPFNWIGAVSLPADVVVRDGVLRSSGIMGPLGSGAFAGALVPLFIWLQTDRKSKIAAYAGLAGAGAMLITTHASTPWMTFAAGIFGLCCWTLRKRMRFIRWAIAFILVSLHMVMKAPVWHLISRLDLTGSSSSYHRYTLINQTIIHFSDWWLLGYRYYDKWDWDMWDTSNLFVAAALTGGLVTLVFVIGVFSRSFGAIGTARKRVSGDRQQEWFLWCLGSALFACLVASFGIAFLYQSQFLLFALPAFISIATFEAKRVSERMKLELPARAAVLAGASATEISIDAGERASLEV